MVDTTDMLPPLPVTSKSTRDNNKDEAESVVQDHDFHECENDTVPSELLAENEEETEEENVTASVRARDK
jgi:hypothetical protein